jgi:hypothetical protein
VAASATIWRGYFRLQWLFVQRLRLQRLVPVEKGLGSGRAQKFGPFWQSADTDDTESTENPLPIAIAPHGFF